MSASGMYTAQHVANYFLKRAKEDKAGLTILKLLKLVYIAYGWVLALLGRRLFAENIQAWKHGPVIPSLYHEFKHYRNNPINELAGQFDMENFQFSAPEVSGDDQEVMLVLDKVWEAYKGFSGWQLRGKTHEPGTPWSDVYRDGMYDIVIPDEKISAHYRQRITAYLDAARDQSAA